MGRLTRRMGPSTYLLLGMLVIAAGVAAARDPALLGRGLSTSGKLLETVWLELALGFLLAGMIDVAIPREALVRWMGEERLGAGLAIGSLAGVLFPGGPYVAFPVAAGLLRGGAAPGPVIAFLTAKSLLGLSRTLAWEVPMMGWRMTLARVLPALILPPVLGLLGHWVFQLLGRGR